MKTAVVVYKLDNLTRAFLKDFPRKVDILSDGAGLDSTKQIAKDYGMEYLSAGKRINISAQVNMLYQHVFESDDAVLFMQNDTLNFKGLDELFNAVKSTKYGVYFGTQYGLKRKKVSVRVPFSIAKLATHFRNYGFVESSWFSVYAIKKWVYEKCGGWDESFEPVGFAGDDDFMMRLIKNDIPVCHVKEFRFWHRKHSAADYLGVEDKSYYSDVDMGTKRFTEKWGVPPFGNTRKYPRINDTISGKNL